MSNSRLLAIDGKEVLFRYRDRRDGNEWKTTSFPGVEFIERFLRHLLPKGFRHIRRCDLWCNAVRTEKLTLLRRLLDITPPEPLDEALPTSDQSCPASRWIWSYCDWRPSKARRARAAAVAAIVLQTHQTPRAPVAELMPMPPSMEMMMERGPVQLHLPLSALLCLRLSTLSPVNDEALDFLLAVGELHHSLGLADHREAYPRWTANTTDR